ncbi:AAA family ATPase [Moraxella nonliquefaciens]|uniref:DNA 3'-5' helicase II n=1 Tax=Moraxella nonliquefaciens TaxID=478 RepID=A0A1B8QS60_MORNO|nr:AAA family ATPase [Moraxella nonliquefaciens]OBX87196.1 hypothetical protein A7456_08645 [Moraxella nonliquefaciens]QPT44178.1 AAA family ATPase [Moraxella nonliquefaciens]QQC29197.1 AAA family ATPase [Moraxella nonliquefaciens]
MDKSRRFGLPNIEDLTKNQEKIMALPNEGRYLIAGGPGTGKSVVALFRIKRLQREQKMYHCLVYNKLLNESNQQLADAHDTATTQIHLATYLDWFNNQIYKKIFHKTVPRINITENYIDNDWDNIILNIKQYKNNPDKTLPDFSNYYLVIDEGQDMAKGFYESLLLIGFKNIFVVADQNQRIGENNSSLEDICCILNLDEDEEVFDLTDNHRNTHAIAMLCQQFYTGGSVLPDLLSSTMNEEAPILYYYDENNFGVLINRIFLTAINKPKELIGIIAPNNAICQRYFNELQQRNSEGNINIIFRNSQNENNINFGEGGIVIINHQACKGLEFDTVFLADINHLRTKKEDIDGLKKKLYVMTSRAKKKLILLSSAQKNHVNNNWISALDLMPTHKNELGNVILKTEVL